MAFEWLAWSNPVSVWWCFLVGMSTINIALWIWLKRKIDKMDFSIHPAGKYILIVTKLSGAFAIGCAFRAVLPRADIQRIALFDTWFSSILLGRFVATVAEICFALQWAIVLYYISKAAQSWISAKISYCIVPLIVIAEIFSWYAVITQNNFGSMIENSIWTMTFILIATALLILYRSFYGRMRSIINVIIAGIVLYIIFMYTVDLPMYFHRWQMDGQAGKQFLGFLKGLKDLNSHWVVTYNIALWRLEIPWMTLYFTTGVWASFILCYIILFQGKSGPKKKSRRLDNSSAY
jgi:hypothetical protein